MIPLCFDYRCLKLGPVSPHILTASDYSQITLGLFTDFFYTRMRYDAPDDTYQEQTTSVPIGRPLRIIRGFLPSRPVF